MKKPLLERSKSTQLGALRTTWEWIVKWEKEIDGEYEMGKNENKHDYWKELVRHKFQTKLHFDWTIHPMLLSTFTHLINLAKKHRLKQMERSNRGERQNRLSRARKTVIDFFDPYLPPSPPCPTDELRLQIAQYDLNEDTYF